MRGRKLCALNTIRRSETRIGLLIELGREGEALLLGWHAKIVDADGIQEEHGMERFTMAMAIDARDCFFNYDSVHSSVGAHFGREAGASGSSVIQMASDINVICHGNSAPLWAILLDNMERMYQLEHRHTYRRACSSTADDV